MGRRQKKRNKGEEHGILITATDAKGRTADELPSTSLGTPISPPVPQRVNRPKKVRVDKPSRRSSFAFCAHPTKEELVLFGGEFHNGRKTIPYNDLFFYKIKKNSWTLLDIIHAPAPRCGHQMVPVAKGKGQLWVSAGEYPTVHESEFQHYDDLWVFYIGEKRWEEIKSPDGPSGRSGHRMVQYGNNLLIFGGYQDHVKKQYYFNDFFSFDLETRKWTKIKLSGTPPSQRTGCQMAVASDGKIIVHGGYFKEPTQHCSKGVVYSDTYLLYPDKADPTGEHWKSSCIALGGAPLPGLAGVSSTTGPGDLTYCFGGVYEDLQIGDEVIGVFLNDLFILDLNKKTFKQVFVSNSQPFFPPKRRRSSKYRSRDAVGVDVESEQTEPPQPQNDDAELREVCSTLHNIFGVNADPYTSKVPRESRYGPNAKNQLLPSPRINCGIAVKQGRLYVYGGSYEENYKLLTYCDMFSLDLAKPDKWDVLATDEGAGAAWYSPTESSDEEGITKPFGPLFAPPEDEFKNVDVNGASGSLLYYY